MSDVLRKFPDSVLKIRAKEVKEFQGIGELTERMLKIMVDNNGIGLAANQIGVSSQVFVMKLDEEDEPIRIVNPVIIEASGEDGFEEGCLSVPNTYVEIVRPDTLLLRGLDPEGNQVEYKLEGLKSRVAQHEIDHLNGIVIVDYLPKREKLRFIIEYENMLREGKTISYNKEATESTEDTKKKHREIEL